MSSGVNTWTHTICEWCWFAKNPDRYPTQVKDPDEPPNTVDECCFCGTTKVTRIYVRHDPKDPALVCYGTDKHAGDG